MGLVSVLGFAFALSIDGFGAGIAYGLRGVRIPLPCLLLINFMSCAALGLSMFGGHFLAGYITEGFAQYLGATILISVGLWTIFQTWHHRKEEKDNFPSGSTTTHVEDERKVLEVKIKSMGFVIQIFREPLKADIDASGFLSVRESFLLGIALAVDSLGAGFGLAMSGFQIWLAPLVIGLVQFCMIRSGVYLGKKYSARWLGKKVAQLPGWILIAIGISRLF